MPRLDAHHEIVKRALTKDGWIITHDPLVIKHQGLRVFIDLAAEKQELKSERVAIEIKVFTGRSEIDSFEKAIGQYSLYQDILIETKSDRELFLAVAQKTYDDFFQIPAVQSYVVRHKIHLLVFDDESEEVIAWIRQPD